ncbi:hypothetical protein ScPMuIL_007439, partial [Solemya velum]
IAEAIRRMLEVNIELSSRLQLQEFLINGAREVYWPIPKTTGSFRLGAEGCVDLIFTEPTSGYKYYPDHLPVVDVVNPGMVCLVNGDKVRVALSMKQLHQLQDNPIYGGWADDGGMQQCIDELGTVIDLLFNGKTARVQYEDAKIWTLNRSALTRIHSFKEKEAVKILSNYNTVKELQEGHGGWNDEMQEALGEAGRIVSIESDGDFRVKVKSRIWILSPVCVMPLENDGLASNLPPPLTAADLNDEENDDDEDSSIQGESSYNALAEALAVFITEMMTPKDDVDLEVKIVQAATQGDLQTVKEIVSSHPNMVNRKLEGKSALQLASYEGNTDIVDYLLQKKADVSLDDDEGDTALHYAAFGKEPEALRLLLQNGAKCDAQNNKKQMALHISIAKGCAKCTKQLLNHGSSVTIKDVDGDTPMHDSISAKDGQPEIVQIVLNAKNANFTLENGKGFPVICWAALKDNREALDIMIGKDKSIVDVKLQNEGFTSLHIAAVNDHIEIASDLIHKGKCDVNAQDKVGRNALHLAVAQGHKRTVELLVSAGCDVNCQDNLGNTPLHIAQMSDDSNPALEKENQDLLAGRSIQAILKNGKSARVMAVHSPNPKAKHSTGSSTEKLDVEQQHGIHSKKLASMRRSTQRGFMLPLNWESMDGQGFKKVPLSQTKGMEAVEYKEVSQRFRKTLPQSTILSITRVQQPNLWELYHLKRTQMEKEYGSGCANEQQVFHGTLPDVVDTICMQNFDFRLAGERVGTLFGKGTYFAVEAKYSDGYAQPDKNRTKCLKDTGILEVWKSSCRLSHQCDSQRLIQDEYLLRHP